MQTTRPATPMPGLHEFEQEKVSPEIRLNKYSEVQRKMDGGHSYMGMNCYQLLPCHRIPEEERNQGYRGNGGVNFHYLELAPIYPGK